MGKRQVSLLDQTVAQRAFQPILVDDRNAVVAGLARLRRFGIDIGGHHQTHLHRNGGPYDKPQSFQQVDPLVARTVHRPGQDQPIAPMQPEPRSAAAVERASRYGNRRGGAHHRLAQDDIALRVVVRDNLRGTVTPMLPAACMVALRFAVGFLRGVRTGISRRNGIGLQVFRIRRPGPVMGAVRGIRLAIVAASRMPARGRIRHRGPGDRRVDDVRIDRQQLSDLPRR